MEQRNLEKFAKELDADENYRVIRRLEMPHSYTQEERIGKVKKVGLYLDVETTGLKHDVDKIIELAMILFEFDLDGNIYKIIKEYDSLQDPGCEIPAHITEITGITDEMVEGQSINAEEVKHLVNQANIVVAHSAEFDRQFCENKWEIFKQKAWACSLNGIPWKTMGIESGKLEYIAYRFGFFFDGHRAINDAQAGVHILAQCFPGTDVSVMKTLIDRAREAEYRIWAIQSPFDLKELLKTRKYRWNPGDNNLPKSWYIDVPAEQVKDEIAFLQQEIYQSEVELRIDQCTAFERFTNRFRLTNKNTPNCRNFR